MSGKLIIATTARSGSELFCAAIQKAGGMGNPQEYFNFNLSGSFPQLAPAQRDTFAGHFECFRSGGFRVDGVDAVKLMWTDACALRDEVGAQALDEWKDAQWVYLRRGDKIAQAVSLSRANITGQWHLVSDQAAPVDAAYLDFYSQLAELRFIESQESGWESFFSENRIVPLRVWFEDFLVSPDDCLGRLARAMGAQGVRPIALSELSVRKVGTRQSKEWRSLFGICLERGLLDNGVQRTDHFLTADAGLTLKAEVAEVDGPHVEVGVEVQNAGDQPIRLRRSLWGRSLPVCVGVQWARIDRVFAKHIDGSVELPEALLPGERFRVRLKARRPEADARHEAFVILFLQGDYAIRLLGGSSPQLRSIAVGKQA